MRISAPGPEELPGLLPSHLVDRLGFDRVISRETTLRVGGRADTYLSVERSDDLIEAVCAVQSAGIPYLLLGGGSNICVSDAGVRGLVIHNACASCEIGESATVDTGHNFIELFLKSLKAGLGGLEFAVGIPGTVGGALVSNAGAYRQNICDIVRSLQVVEDGQVKRVEPDWMGFSYRNSRLRQPGTPSAVVVSVELELTPRPRKEILDRARDNQRQRIFKQPWWPSAGSFFKNVNDKALAAVVPGLTDGMRSAGVVPAGYLSEAVGCKGLAVGGAQISLRHGNFVVNRGDATATDIRRLTAEVKRRVFEHFGAKLEEEVLFVGDWSRWEANP